MGKVKTQTFRFHQGSGLVNMVAQYFLERFMQQVGSRVIPAYGQSSPAVHLRQYRLILFDHAFDHFTPVYKKVFHRFEYFRNLYN